MLYYKLGSLSNDHLSGTHPPEVDFSHSLAMILNKFLGKSYLPKGKDLSKFLGKSYLSKDT